MSVTLTPAPESTDAEAEDRRVAGARSPARVYLLIRLLIIAGEMAGVLLAANAFHMPLQQSLCFVLIGTMVLATVLFVSMTTGGRSAEPWEVSGHLAFDILQGSALLYLVGGPNPFGLLLIIPAMVGGTMLGRADALALAALAILCLLISAGAASLFPAVPHLGPSPSLGVRVAATLAVSVAIGFSALYSSHVASDGKRMALALHMTERVLAREQRLSALGGLAAAAAHELGTPLATITVVARELTRELPEGPSRDDALLMVEQAQRCRDILKRLAETPEVTDAVHERMTLIQLVREVLAPYAKRSEPGGVRAEAVVTGPPEVTAPEIWRRPEVLHAIAAFVENAFDFAKAEILVTARFDAESVAIEVRDDGPGFPAEVLNRLGEPYVTSRPGTEGGRTGHVGVGLGFFIAKTLLERTGGKVSFRNARGAGAMVTVRWPRSLMEASEGLSGGIELSP